MTSPDNATQPSFFKTLIRGSLKISSVIVLSAIGLSISGFVLYKGYLYIEERMNSDLLEVKNYEVDLEEHLNVSVKIQTKYVDETVMYKVEVLGFPTYMEDPNNKELGFWLRFLDKDNFEVSRKHLPLNEATKLAGSSAGSVRGIAFQGNLYLEPSEYRQVVDVRVGWNLLTDRPKPKPKKVAKPTEEKVSNSNHCEPNLSKEERLKRLATRGVLEQSSENSFRAGNSYVRFSSGGALLSCY